MEYLREGGPGPWASINHFGTHGISIPWDGWSVDIEGEVELQTYRKVAGEMLSASGSCTLSVFIISLYSVPLLPLPFRFADCWRPGSMASRPFTEPFRTAQCSNLDSAWVFLASCTPFLATAPTVLSSLFPAGVGSNPGGPIALIQDSLTVLCCL